MNEETVLVHNGLTMSVILVFELTSPHQQTDRQTHIDQTLEPHN